MWSPTLLKHRPNRLVSCPQDRYHFYIWSWVDDCVHRFDSGLGKYDTMYTTDEMWNGIAVQYGTNDYRDLSRLSPTYREGPPPASSEDGGISWSPSSISGESSSNMDSDLDALIDNAGAKRSKRPRARGLTTSQPGKSSKRSRKTPPPPPPASSSAAASTGQTNVPTTIPPSQAVVSVVAPASQTDIAAVVESQPPVAAKRNKRLKELKEFFLSSEFDMKDHEVAKTIMGVNIKRNKSSSDLFLGQSESIDRQVCNKRSASLPLSSQFQISAKQSPKTESERKEMEKFHTQNAIGSVMYSMVCTRPDLAYSTSILSRYMGDPGKPHWVALKWMLRCMAMTTDYGLRFKKKYDTIQVEGDKDSRKSSTSFVFLVSGNCVSWK
ncbi:uncharacterized protein LOC133786015 [Humulus lupulus]|uniref:uncharacterized protein LOC133786015 n=1 Tax=Humulus lupulus TaxID=3486 RepID=UPI002B40128E|nr:uncharacterized protein LOC133786015 [Humulus lupulus]